MHFYIYPKGGNATYIAHSCDFLNKKANTNFTYEFLDDKDENTNLKAKAKEIKKAQKNGSGELLLSSLIYLDSLLDNCAKNEIKPKNGIKEIGILLNEYFKKHLAQKYPNKRIICIQLHWYEKNQKHLGNIIPLLEKQGFIIVYLIKFANRFAQDFIKELEEQNKEYVCADFELINELNFFPFIITQAEIIIAHKSVAQLKIHASFDMINQPFCFSKENQESQNLGYHYCTYISCHTKRMRELLAQKQSYDGTWPNQNTRLIEGGYPSIDKEFEKISQNKEIWDFEKRDSVIILSSDFLQAQPKRLAKIIESLLDNNFRVVFKTCPAYENDELNKIELDFANQFINHSNFILYEKHRLNQEEQKRAICVCEFMSSMLYSFPILTNRPALLLYPKESECKENEIKNDPFYEPNLHIRIFAENDETIPAICRKLQEKKEQEIWAQKIENFRQNELYNFGKASEFLVQFICDWYERREACEWFN